MVVRPLASQKREHNVFISFLDVQAKSDLKAKRCFHLFPQCSSLFSLLFKLRAISKLRDVFISFLDVQVCFPWCPKVQIFLNAFFPLGTGIKFLSKFQFGSNSQTSFQPDLMSGSTYLQCQNWRVGFLKPDQNLPPHTLPRTRKKPMPKFNYPEM